MSQTVRTAQEAEFLIANKYSDVITTTVALFKKYPHSELQQTLLSGTFAAGFLDGLQWLAQEIFKALERDGVIQKDGPELETLHLLLAALKPIETAKHTILMLESPLQ